MTAPADREALIEVMAQDYLRDTPPTARSSGANRALHRAAQSIVTSILTAIEAAGCAVVPVETTEAMQIGQRYAADEFWRDMLAASPYRPEDGG